MRTRLRAAVAALVAAALLAGATAAGADERPKTKIVIMKLRHSGASGKVSSHDHGCLGDRKVSLFRLENFISNKIAITHTDSNGGWKVKKNLNNGRYFAKVDAGGGCRYDNSKNETLR